LTSLQVEGAGPSQAPPIPVHLHASTFFAVWSEAAMNMGWSLPDPAAFDAMTAFILARNDAQAKGAPWPGAPGWQQGAPPPAAPSAPGPAAPAAQPPPVSRPAPASHSASGPSFFGPRSFGPTPQEARDQGKGKTATGSRGSAHRLSGLDAYMFTTGVPVPKSGLWAIPIPPHCEEPLDGSDFSSPTSHRSRSRSPKGAPAPPTPDGSGLLAGASVGGLPA
jgi:hypothetical protein